MLLCGMNVNSAVVTTAIERDQSCVSWIDSSGLRHYATLLGVKKKNKSR